MALNKKDFVVLCPNGRRVNIKSPSSASIGQIIEEACQKQKLDPLNYNLKHLKRTLDPSNTIQYSNIPNRAQLELVEAETRRKELDVVVNLVTEEGQRLIHEFSSNSTLWNMLTYYDANEGNDFALPPTSSNLEPFVVYTMRKLSGEELKSVTLKSLGLYGGKCMMRYGTQVKETESRKRASSPVVIVTKTAQATSKSTSNNAKLSSFDSEEMVYDTTEESRSVSMQESFPMETESEDLELQNSTVPNTSQVDEGYSNSSETDIQGDQLVSDSCSLTSNQVGTGSDEMEFTQEASTDTEGVDSQHTPKLHTSEETPITNKIPLSDHDAILFSLDDAPPSQQSNEDDAFFQLTSEEIRGLHREQMKQIQELEEAPLMTSQMREMEKSSRLLTALNQYPVIQLRICFPDRLVIQANFKPHSTVKEVIDFLKPLLIRSDLNFYLYTMFPRKILDPGNTLVEEGCIPKARIYFGTEEENLLSYLSEESLSKKSSFDAASKSIIKSKVRQSNDEVTTNSSNPPKINSSKSNEEQSVKIKSSQKPKWFKLGK